LSALAGSASVPPASCWERRRPAGIFVLGEEGMAYTEGMASTETTRIEVGASLSEAYRSRLEKAIAILRGFGCSEIHLFGSLARGEARDDSDIDLAVRGCPKSKFFHVLGLLLTELDRSVDLVDLDSADPFARYLEEHQELLQIA
jgi:predicted nucleotidyltransferase